MATAAAALTPPDRAIRPVRPELLHVTLAFVGRVDDARLDDVVAAARDAAASQPPFGVTLDTAGTFPETGTPHVVWIGMSEGAAESGALATAVRSALAARDVPFDDKPFRPHVTLGRVREETDRAEARAIAGRMKKLAFAPLRWTAREIIPFESVLSPKGPRYTARATVPLGVGG
jgi:2'-5' RNA ligase